MKIFLTFILVLFSVSLNALPIKSDHLYSRNDYKNVVTNIFFTSIARFGNNSYCGTYELGTGKTSPAHKDQFYWEKNKAEHFFLKYNSSANLITYSTGSKNFNYIINGGVTDIFIKTRATKKGAWISIDNLLLNGEIIDDYSYADYYGNKVDYLHISSLMFRDNFILEGYSTMSWFDNKLPAYSRLSYKITLVSVIDSYGVGYDDSKYEAPVPEPLTIILLLSASLTCLIHKKN